MIRNMFIGAASAAALALAIPAAQAADLPAYEPAPEVSVPSFTWTGPYLGVQAGYGWGRQLDRKSNGFIVGGFAGYNHQFDNSPVVVGIETDFNYADIDGRRGGDRRARTSTDWNGATRAKLGYAFDRFMVYGAAGVAYADRDLKVRGLGRDNGTTVGYTVGGGVESAITDNILARVEYRYTDYGKETYKIAGQRFKTDYDEHRVMGGVSYKFSTSGW